MKIAAIVLILAGVAGSLVWAVMNTEAPAVAAPSVQGCPACHGAAGREPTLDAVAKQVKNHPVSAAKTVAQCAVCHTAGPRPAPFKTLLHQKHLGSKKFAGYKGACTSCHQVDLTTGRVSVFGLER